MGDDLEARIHHDRRFHNAIVSAAQSSSKPKLCLVGSHDQFCTQQQFARFVDGLHEPATAKVATGPLVADGCGHGGCSSAGSSAAA